MGRFINLGIAIVNTSYIIRVEMESNGRAKSICPMARCFAAITSMPPNYMAQMKKKRVRPRCICKRNSDMTNHTPCLLDEAATFMKVQYLSLTCGSCPLTVDPV